MKAHSSKRSLAIFRGKNISTFFDSGLSIRWELSKGAHTFYYLSLISQIQIKTFQTIPRQKKTCKLLLSVLIKEKRIKFINLFCFFPKKIRDFSKNVEN